jgi:hypothetical protein
MDLSYETAKRLKDAGFPQKYINITDRNCEDPQHSSFSHMGGCCGCFTPTLSELIEACGEDVDALLRGLSEDMGEWFAGRWQTGEDGDGVWSRYEPHGFGSTPEEAVAELWLALHSHGGRA